MIVIAYPPKMVFAGSSYPARGGLRVRCPSCLHLVTLLPTSANDVSLMDAAREEDWEYSHTVCQVGMRICPNEECRQSVFVVYTGDEIDGTWPPERLDFDATNIPEQVLAALEEAISCHAVGCYVAAGMMVRKTLEELL